MSKPSKKLGELLSKTEIKIAVDAVAYEDAVWLDALAEEVNKEVEESEIDKEWSEFKRTIQKAPQRRSKYSVKSNKL